MRGIRLSHGAIFVTDGLGTVRLLPGKRCEASPIAYAVLEHDLSAEPPLSWEYMSESDIKNLPNGEDEQVIQEIRRIRSALGI